MAVEKIQLAAPDASDSPAGEAQKQGSEKLEPQKDMHGLVKTVIKDMNAGKPVADMACKNRVDPDLVEQICRMYATHPGVDVDGILDRIERRNL